MSFEDFWRSYPRKVGKRVAEKAYAAALLRDDEAAIMEGLHRYRKDSARISKGVEFTVHPTTWLNQDRWLDDLTQEPTAPFIDVVARFDDIPEGITFDEWLENHATPAEIVKAKEFGVAQSLEVVGNA